MKPAPTILVVDDEESVRKMIRLRLERLGYRVLEAENGSASIHIALDAPEVRLALVDVMMPEMDGYETVGMLRELYGPDFPVVMVTALDDDDAILAGYGAGVDYYLPKCQAGRRIAAAVSYLLGIGSAEELRQNELCL